MSDLPRTPYERYQTLRGEAPPIERPNEFGVEQKALRERLAPMESR
ncbi:MAG: hypothetical protein AAGA57_00585 [Planctomycetota bacterium]